MIPIENSILYVSPLYLRAEQGQLPELKRVIALYGDHVVMKETLAEALSALFAEPGAAPERADVAPGAFARPRLGGQGAKPLQPSCGALEIRRLGRVWGGVRYDRCHFGAHEPGIGQPLG